MSAMRILLLTGALFYFLFSLAQCDEAALQLDDSTRRLALSLVREFANKTRLAELMSNGTSHDPSAALERFPSKPVAEIYRNYTLEQIAALEAELSQHEHFIYQPIQEKTKEVSRQFGAACQSYEVDGDLVSFERRFLKTGKQLVGLQKTVLRIINSKLEEKLKPAKTNYRMGRNWVYSLFDRLNGLLLGTSSDEALYKSSEVSQVNKMYSLMLALEKIEHVQPTDEATKAKVDQLKGLLYRLRKVYQLNSIASVRNHYLNTEYISPYNYEAMLRLVQLLGSAQQTFNQRTFNPVMSMFRTWLNFINGGNIFFSLIGPFGGFGPSAPAAPVPPKYNAQKLRALIKMLEDNERVRQQQIERNREKLALENLIKNQNRQQQQIAEILKALANQPVVTSTTPFPAPWLPPSSRPPLPTPWPNRPTLFPSNNNPTDVLRKLKEQRRHLNELLQELQKPIANSPGSAMGSAGALWPNLFPSAGNGSSSTSRPDPANQPPQGNELMQAQQALMGIMKNITPLINMMGQSGMVSPPKLERSKFQMLDILNAVSNRELDDDEVEDKAKELQRVEKLGEQLETVLDGIIDEAETKVSAGSA